MGYVFYKLISEYMSITSWASVEFGRFSIYSATLDSFELVWKLVWQFLLLFLLQFGTPVSVSLLDDEIWLEIAGMQFLLFDSSVFDDGTTIFESLFFLMQIINA